MLKETRISQPITPPPHQGELPYYLALKLSLLGGRLWSMTWVEWLWLSPEDGAMEHQRCSGLTEAHS